MVNQLKPHKGVGDILLYESIKKYSFKYDFELCASSDATGWDEYRLNDSEVIVYTENETIQAISCCKSLVYRNIEIIGLKLLEFLNKFELTIEDTPDRADITEDEFQYVYEFNKLGLQVWCKDSMIVTVIVS